ncbi:MAG: PfkB family carbohydrate kinase [Chloroflexota bacterium]
MTDDIPPAGGPIPVDLLIIGGITVDDLLGWGEAAGGAARYATEAALAAGLRVTLHTVAGDEPVVREALDGLAAQADVISHPAPSSIRFEHHGTDDARRLRLRGVTDPIPLPEPDRFPVAAAVLFAPVAGEVSADAVQAVRAPFRAASLQGWLRRPDLDGWVMTRPLAELEPGLAGALRGLDLLIASREDLAALDGPGALAQLRAWAGPRTQLVVTAGTEGAWLDDGVGPASHVRAEVVAARNTIGAGDAFAAVLVARRGAGRALRDAAEDAASATTAYLGNRTPPG